jgi:hypothetical protein
MGIVSNTRGRLVGLPRFAVPLYRIPRISISQLDTVLHEVESATLKARNLTAGGSQAQLITSLEPTSWSATQCLDHLAQTTNVFLPLIAHAMTQAPRLTSNRRLRTGALTRLFLRNLGSPSRLRFKVPAPLVPQHQDFSSAWSAFEQSQAKLARTIDSAMGLAIDRVRVESPVYARFSYNAYGTLRMLTTHQRRHLWQIEQILKALDGAQLCNPS